MSKSSEEAEADRLTSEEFVDLIPHLPFENILQIEFLTNGWKKLIATVDIAKRLYRCNLCHPILSGYKSVLSHINGKKHLANMTTAKHFYHPEYTFTKAQLQKASGESKNKATNEVQSAVKPNTKSAAPLNKNNNESQIKNAKPEGTDLKKDSKISESLETSNKNPTAGNGKPSNNTNKTSQIMSENKESTDSQSIQKQTQIISQNNSKENKESSNNESSNTLQNNKTPQKRINSTNMKPNNDNKAENSSKPLLRLVPISALKEKSEVTPIETVKVTAKDLKQNTSNNDTKLKNPNLGKTSITANQKQNQCATKSNEDPKLTVKNSQTEKSNKNNQQPIAKGDKCSPNKSLDDLKNKEQQRTNESTSQKKENETLNSKNQKPLPNVRPTNLIESKTKNKDPQKSENKPVETPSKQLNNVANSDKDASRKLVKNPLAAKKNDDLTVVEKPSNETLNNVAVEDVIVIEDNDEEVQSKSNNAIKSVIQKPEPPAKKLKCEPSTLEVCTTSKNKNVASARPNLVMIPTKSNSNLNKSQEKTSNEPAFAVKSVTDVLDNEEFHGFVGVEYVIKICRRGAPIKYECGLCELVLGGQSMQNHLLGYNHRIKFCEKHFPTAIQQFRQYIVNVPSDEHYKVMIPVLQKLTAAIEEHHGRCLPFECDEIRYNLERHRVLTEVFARKHASEQTGPTFTHVIDSRQVDEFILRKDSMTLQPNSNKITFDRITTEGVVNQSSNQQVKRHSHNPSKNISHNAMPYQSRNMQPSRPVQSSNHSFSGQNTYMDDETHKRMVESFLQANSKSSFSQQKSFRSDRNEREHRNTQPSKRSHSPHRPSFGSKKNQHSSLDIWSSYCRLVDSNLKILKERFQKYKANPESHPSYKDEWLKFWHRRKSELMAIGKDYRTYDFQPDWVPYFNNRINELYDESFAKLKIEAREELSLPMTNDLLCDPKYFVDVQTDNYMPAIKKATPSSTTNVINDSQMHIDTSPSYKFNPERSNRQHSNIVDSKMNSNSKEIQIRDESAPTVISVLRLLTALEEYLGSLGPKIVELLSKALQAEKSNQGRAQVLLTDENCTVLETAMEKFKGLVITGILDAPKERALKKAISKVSALLEYTKDMKEKQSSFQQDKKVSSAFERNTLSNEDPRMTNQKPTQNINEKLKQTLQSVSNASDISKVIHLIEEKIATALKAQGRTDVDRAHLEQLAAVCVLLEKKKREAGNATNQELTTQKQTFQQPLSDTLKKIVGNISSNSYEQGYKNKNDDVNQLSTDFNSQGMFPSMLGTARKDNISALNPRMQNYNPTTNVDELNKFNNNSTTQGNFSNLYGINNNEPRMGDNSNFVANSQLRQWPQQQNQSSVSSSLGWPQNPGGPWRANETTSTAGPGLQRGGYQSFGQKPSVQDRFRYN